MVKMKYMENLKKNKMSGKLKFSGVVVLYKPNVKKVCNNINTYIDSLDKLYIVDNSGYKNIDIYNQYKDNRKVEYIVLNKNMGIAHALNIGMKNSINEEFDWFLTMDQDSKFEKNNFEKFKKFIIEKSCNYKNTAILAPHHVTMLYEEDNNNEETLKVLDVMTSGNFINLNIAKKIGFFREDFFIDAVDIEYCLRINSKKYEVRIVNFIKMNHELGNEKRVRILNRYPIIYNYNYIRRYYITRNTLFTCKQYKSYFPKRCNEIKLNILKTTIKSITMEADKLRKIKSIFIGYIDYKTGKLGNKFNN